MSRYVIGIDGGGSKTAAVLLDERGTVLGRGAAGSSNYHHIGQENVLETLLEAMVENPEKAVGSLSIVGESERRQILTTWLRDRMVEQQFLTEGRMWEVLLYTRDNAVADTVAWRELSPVILADGKVTGWGWDYWEDQAENLKIPVPANVD